MTIKEEVVAPQRTGKPEEVITIEGLLMATHQKHMVLLDVPRSESRYLPLFPNMESLKNILGVADAPWDTIKKVTDQEQFVESIPKDIKIAVNPRIMPDGKMRWTEISR